VADLSESGVRLTFAWPGGGDFPLRAGDSIGFVMTVAGSDRSFELMSIVRRVTADRRAGRAHVGVEFFGLDSPLREAVQSAILNLALTKLRARGPEDGEAEGIPVEPSAAASLPAVELPKRSVTSRLARFEAGAQPSAAPAAPAAKAPEPPAAAAEQAPVPDRRQTQVRRRMYLGEILVNQGAVASAELEKYLRRAPGDSMPIGQKLMSHGLVDDITLARALAEQCGLKYVDLADDSSVDGRMAHSLPRELFTRLHAVPLRVEGTALLVAFASRPTPMDMEELERAAGRRTRACIAAEGGITRWLKKLYNYEAPARFARARFPVQLRVEYRFMDGARTGVVHDFPVAGITRELGEREMVIAGPLPSGIDAERIRRDGLVMRVDVEGGKLPNQMTLDCRVLSVSNSGFEGEYHLACYIESFPPGGEKAWVRLCMTMR
jgi:hypothetical protein